MAQKATFEIDGARFSTLEEFYDEISRVLIPGPTGAATSTHSMTFCGVDLELLKEGLSSIGRTQNCPGSGWGIWRLCVSLNCN
jgi:hypothetical protein